MKEKGAELQVLAGGQRLERKLTGEPPLVVLDNNVISHYIILYQLIRQKGEWVFQGTALIPQALLTLPLKAKPLGSAALKSREKTIQVEKHIVQLGDVQIRLYGQTGTLFAVENPVQQFLAYRQDLFPEAVEIAAGEAQGFPPEGVQEVELTFPSDGLQLVGTLTLPDKFSKPVPAVLLLPGSGPVDRDENMPGFELNFLKIVAHRLAQAGIGSFRYDKRGIGKSGGVFSKTSMTDLVNDARAAIRFLKARKEVDPNRIFLLGHSEGGVLGSILAAEGLVSGLILVSSPAHPLDWLLVEQARTLYEMRGLSSEQVEEQVERTRQFVRFVKETQGEWEDFTYEQIKELLPWMTEQEFQEYQQGMSLQWYREHFTHDPLETIRGVKIPVLIIHGGKDLQVPKGEAELLAQALKEAGNENVELHILPDMNHLLRYHPEPPNLQYRHLDEPVDSRVLQIILDWLAPKV